MEDKLKEEITEVANQVLDVLQKKYPEPTEQDVEKMMTVLVICEETIKGCLHLARKALSDESEAQEV